MPCSSLMKGRGGVIGNKETEEGDQKGLQLQQAEGKNCQPEKASGERGGKRGQ